MKFRRPPAGWLLEVAFFAGFLAYTLLGIDSRLIHHWQAPVFFMTAGFAAEFLKYPGGFLDYLYALIAQTFTSQVWGAVMLTAQVAAIAALTRFCCRTWPLLRFAPAVLLVYPLNLYYDRTPLLLSLLLALGAATPLVRSKSVPGWLFLVSFPVVYYLGGMALVFFALIAVGTFVSRREYTVGIISLLVAAAIPLAVERSHLILVPASARDWLLAPDPAKLAIWWTLYVFYAMVGLISGRRKPPEPARSRRAGKSPVRRLWPTFVAPIAVLACLGAMAVLSYRASARDRRLAALDYQTTHENWPEVLFASQKLVSADYNSLTRYEVNLALHEMNRLADEMFSIPQAGSMIPPLRSEVFLPYMIRVTDLFMRLGRMNDAEHFGNEAIILGQSDPRVFRLMADLNIVKGQTETARKFLNILSDEAGSARWARRRLRELDSDPRLAADSSIQLLRRRMLRNDDLIPVWQNPDKPDADVNRLLLDQLDQDPSNRMAFEFLMGNYMLARDLTAAAGLMPRIRHITGPAYVTPDGRRRTPRHYQEAMAMYSDATGQQLESKDLGVEPETLNRMAVFKRLLQQSGGKDAAMQAAWARFRDSYFFYYVFGPGDYR